MTTGKQTTHRPWLRRKVASFTYRRRGDPRDGPPEPPFPLESESLYRNPFTIADLDAFDDATVRGIFLAEDAQVTLDDLAAAFHDAPPPLVERVRAQLPTDLRRRFTRRLRRDETSEAVSEASRRILDALFWELTYWKTPELYEELTEGERLHPGIFRDLAPHLRGRVVLDAGAGSGRATFECLGRRAARVYAVEPSAGLLRILREKAVEHPAHRRIVPIQGRFKSLPLDAGSVDLTIACSAFTADPDQGGEEGLAELRRVTKPGGRVVIIWPRVEDHAWFAAHGFHYVTLPMRREMTVHFRSLSSATRVIRRFYGRNREVTRYLAEHKSAEIPFSVLRFTPPHDYCWLKVK